MIDVPWLPPSTTSLVRSVARSGAVAASVLLAAYGDQMLSGVSGVPGPTAQASEDGVAQALEVASLSVRRHICSVFNRHRHSQLDPPRGELLAQSALDAFANGYAAAMWVGAATLLIGAVPRAYSSARRRQ